MTVAELKAALATFQQRNVAIRLPDGDMVPAHFHITEVGHVSKRFIDCGGDTHHNETCLIQAWVADDLDHRFTAGKFAKVLAMLDQIAPADNLPVELEYEDCSISQYPLLSAVAEGDDIVLTVGEKHTDCLAKEACGLTPASSEGCGCGPGCC